MYADRDGARSPHRTPHRRSSPLLALTILGCAAAAAALYLPNPLAAFAPPAPVTPPASVPAATPPLAAPAPPPAIRPRPVAEPTTKPTAATAAPLTHAYRPPLPAAEPGTRQTTFDEHNYRPREIVNRLPAQRAPRVERTTAKRPKPRTRSAKWSWQTHDGIIRGTFKWHEQDGRIDFASVCLNEEAGSLRYRDCRKGAKVAFARLCRERRDPAACHAENNYSALR